METVLVDTSFLVALLCEKDVHHKRAKAAYLELKARYRLLFTDIVLAETLTVLERRAREWKFPFEETVARLREVFPSPARFAIYFLWSFWEAWDQVIESKGNLSFNDALLIVGCKKEEIRKIATFDKGFENYLQVLPLEQ